MAPHAHIDRRMLLKMAGLTLGAFSGAWPALHAAPSEGLGDDLDLSRWLQPVPPTAIFEDPDWCIWCGSMVRDEEGTCHLFYSRWPRKLGHLAWVTHSEVARAVSDNPLGPYRHVEVVLPARGGSYWDASCTHNAYSVRIGKKYCLYYMGNYGDGIVEKPLNWTHRNRQRIGVAVADSPEGPWTRPDRPALDVSADIAAPDSLVVTNPSACERPDGSVLMVYKAVGQKSPLPFGGPVVHLVATAPRPEGPYTKRMTPVFTKPGEHFAAEDPFIWHDGQRYRAVVKDNNGIFTGRGYSIAQFESHDGFDWHPAKHLFVATPATIVLPPGRKTLMAFERPYLWRDERGEPVVLFGAAADTAERGASFNVAVPLKRPA
jgi:hypothetical protein